MTHCIEIINIDPLEGIEIGLCQQDGSDKLSPVVEHGELEPEVVAQAGSAEKMPELPEAEAGEQILD